MSEWQLALKQSTFKFGFGLSLSKNMLAMLCATSDDVHWDKWFTHCLHDPDNWIATSHSLVRRGLIERKREDELKQRKTDWEIKYGNFAHYRLTPAGKLVIELVRMAGLFQEQIASVVKREKGKRERIKTA